MTRKRLLIAASGLVALLATAAGIGLFAIGPGWLEKKLVRDAKEKLNADLKIESVSFSPLKGEAELRGVTFDRKKEGSDVYATVPRVRARVAVWPLLRRKLVLEEIVAENPDVQWTVRQPPDDGRSGALAALKKLVFDEKPERTKKPEVRVGRLAMSGGSVTFTALKPGREPFVVRGTGIRYEGKNVSFHSFGSLARGADIDATLDFGGKAAALQKRGTATPGTMTLKGVNVAYVDRYFDQTDALVVSAGTLDLGYVWQPDGKLGFTADFRELELARNPASGKKTFYLIPVSTLAKKVEERNGAVTLAFTLEDVEAGDDLRVVVEDLWVAMWKALGRYLLKDAIRDIFGNDEPD